MAQFNPYSRYKDSGVEWLGKVPEHWDLYPIGNSLQLIKDNTIGDDWNKTQLLSLTLQGIIKKDINSGKGKTHSDYSTYQKVNINDFIFCLFDIEETPRSVGISKEKGMITSAYTALRVKNKTNSQYLYYFFESRDDLKAFGSEYSGLRKTIRPTKFIKLNICYPSVSEQTQIANYLDQETAKIDTLIAKQEKLIALLEEQRKSVIFHAVTKGLDPNAPMKDSGVEWLGEVPEHWNNLKNRHIFKFSKGLSITKENLIEKGIPCVSYGEVHSKFGFEFDPKIDDMKYVSENYLKTDLSSMLKYGDFIFADTSEDFEGSGNFSYLNGRDNVFAGYHTIIAKLKTPQNSRFIAYFFDSNAHRKQIQTLVKGIKVFSITQGILKDIYVLLPPINEQNNIVDFLDQKISKIHELKLKQKQLIEKLKEYRASIISHAVTGKIDVRELVA